MPRDFHPFYQTSLLSNYIFNLDTDTGEADRDISYCIDKTIDHDPEIRSFHDASSDVAYVLICFASVC